MDLIEITHLLAARLIGKNAQVASISTNTRDLIPGQLFIALKGEQYDGHKFLRQAYEKKAAGAVVSEVTDLPLPQIKVSDTLLALGRIAANHRAQYQLPIIALTGSCGKTTTKTMLASILAQMGSTLSPIKSFNNEIGVPITLLQLNAAHHYAVIEMGANHPKEIAYLSAMAKQGVALITNVAPAHLLGFGSIEGVANAKAEIYEALSEQGIAIVNVDDQFAPDWRKKLKGRRVITFGLQHPADFTANQIALDAEAKASFQLICPWGQAQIRLPLMGAHNIRNALAAAASAYAVGATMAAITKGLCEVEPVSKRLIKYKGWAGAFIIDDTYNANPLSVIAALETLAHVQGEKIFVFADMAELGKDEDQFHCEVGQKAKNLGINKLYACGKLSQLAAKAFGEDGFYFENQENLIAALKPVLQPQTTVLIKGSRLARMENIVTALTQEN